MRLALRTHAGRTLIVANTVECKFMFCTSRELMREPYAGNGERKKENGGMCSQRTSVSRGIWHAGKNVTFNEVFTQISFILRQYSNRTRIRPASELIRED